MANKTIWIVQGSSGEYSDHREWLLKAFEDEKAAQRLVVEAQARANEIKQLDETEEWDTMYDMREKNDPRIVNEFDPDMQVDYTGALYTCYPVELVPAAPPAAPSSLENDSVVAARRSKNSD